MNEINIISLSPNRWQEYKVLRLQALSEYPTIAFESDYQTEALYPAQLWQQRLADSQEKKNNCLLFAERDDQLCGMICALFDQGQGARHRAKICSLYVNLKDVGISLHKKLIESMLEWLDENPVIMHIQVAVNAQNPIALSLYEELGFSKVGLLNKYVRLGENKFQDRYLLEKVLEKNL